MEWDLWNDVIFHLSPWRLEDSSLAAAAEEIGPLYQRLCSFPRFFFMWRIRMLSPRPHFSLFNMKSNLDRFKSPEQKKLRKTMKTLTQIPTCPIQMQMAPHIGRRTDGGPGQYRQIRIMVPQFCPSKFEPLSIIWQYFTKRALLDGTGKYLDYQPNWTIIRWSNKRIWLSGALE